MECFLFIVKIEKFTLGKVQKQFPEVFFLMHVSQLCSRFTGKHPCGSVISKKLLFQNTSVREKRGGDGNSFYALTLPCQMVTKSHTHLNRPAAAFFYRFV